MEHRGRHLGYCTNVHPGESLDALEAMLRRDVVAVKGRVSPDGPFGLGLRLGNTAASELVSSARRRADFSALLQDLDLYVFTVNGFPYGDFAADAVKTAVYSPSWLDPERVAYTRRVATALVGLPGPAARTISTVAGGYKPETDTPEARAVMAGHLAEAAEDLARLADRTGVHIRLCLEPEPWTTLETTADALRLFTEVLFPRGGAVREHLGLCYDCCHQAVHFEDPAASLRQLADAGIVVGKIQVSSALHLGDPADAAARAALLAFDEPRYLHQVVGLTAEGRRLRARDLPDLRAAGAEWLVAEAWRCHFHVPIDWAGDGRLGTTRADWQAAVRASDCPHLEVETYTWHVLPSAARARHDGDDLHAAVAAELTALLAVL